ncbi:MAG: sigma-70 family RNA polymerase sigma factor [Micrococcales bacterium]|nr:sigma-70 family RNA polymerase sigma factor [Micrococcales bacterium]
MAIEGLQRSDAELLATVRAGDAEAFGALYDRHAVAALTVARQYTDSAADAEDVVADSFTAVYDALRRGKGPTEAFRAYLFTVVRRVATVHRDRGRRVQATDDVATLEASAVPLAGADAPALAGFESTVVARAFATLPERWQLVLWHTEVEGLAPAQVAPLLGLSANSASALAYRAREGLRQAYLTEHLADGQDDRCRPVVDRLGAYVRGGLGPRESRKVGEHLDQCPRCTALYAELGDVNHGMRTIVAPLVLGIAGLGALDHLLPVGGGLALGGLPGLIGTGAGGSAGSGAGSAGAASGQVAGGTASSVPVLGAVAAAVVTLVVVAAVAVYALSGKPPSSAAAAVPTGTAPPSAAPSAPPSPVSDESSEPVVDQVRDSLAPLPSDEPVVDQARDSLVLLPSDESSEPVADHPVSPPSDQVASAPARVVVTARAPVTLVTDRTRTLALDVANVGGSTSRASVVVHLPYGVHLGGPSPAGWTCLPRGLTTIGCTAWLDRRTSLPLDLPLGTRADVTPRTGLITIVSAPSSGRIVAVPYTMVRPATLVVTPPADLGPLTQGLVTDLPLTVTNTGGLASAPVGLDLTLPTGVVLGGAVRGDGWTCTDTRCTHDGLAAGASAVLTVPLTGTSGASGAVTVTPGADDADAAPVRVPVQVAADVTPPRVFDGNVRVVQVGAPLLSCTTDPACPGHLAGATDNNGLPMTPLDTDPPPGIRPALPVSSSTTLTYPSGQSVLWAGLYWSANAGPDDTWSTDRTVVQLRGPGGRYQPVSGTITVDVTDSAGRKYYQSLADVTAQVQTARAGTWSLADAAVAATATDPDPTYYAGWALVVVYGNPNAVGSRTVTVHDSGQWIGTDSTQTVLSVAAVPGRQVTVGAVAWEGDAASTGDRLLLDGTALTPVGGSADNAFDSTAAGWGHVNSLGVDAKAFRPVTAASAVVTLTASTSGDQYLLGIVTVTVER